MTTKQQSRVRRIMNYPIRLPRWLRRRPRPTIDSTLAESLLPEKAQMKVREVVQRTRLWKHEKLAVARELIAHFQDGLAAGSGVEELLGSFGDTKMAAKLIRRGKKRNRPLWWRAQRRGLQVMAAVMVVYIGSAMLLALRHPQVRRDFVAELNQPEMAVPPQERGWSIYARAWERVHIQELNTDVFYVNDPVGSAMWRHVRLGDSQWPAAVAFLRQHREFLDLLREAAGKKVFGWELRWGGMSEEQLAGVGAAGRQQWRPPTPRNRAEKLLDESMISVLLPYISPVRQSALLLASDMRLAASEGDTARVLADYRAITGIARQLARTPIVVQQLVALGIMAIGDQTLMTINSQTPEAMTECRVELLHTMASAADPFDLKLSGERSAMLDMIQRIYSDDGHGNGAPTLDGTKLLAQLQGVLHNNIWERSDAGANALHAAALPAVTLTMGSREDATQEMERFLALSAEEIARPLWVKLHTPAISERLINDLRSSWTQRIRYPLLTTLAPSLKAGISFDRGRAVHEAATVALSLEAYRAANGSYPESLTLLVPRYLPEMPPDQSTGGPLRYKLRDGKPLLYGLGKDGVDDGGEFRDEIAKWPAIPESGDWVLYPPPGDWTSEQRAPAPRK